MPARRRVERRPTPASCWTRASAIAPRSSAVETVIAAVENDREHLIAESADLVFHLLVLLKACGVGLAEVEDVLAKRTGQSGLEEKAARKGD